MGSSLMREKEIVMGVGPDIFKHLGSKNHTIMVIFFHSPWDQFDCEAILKPILNVLLHVVND